MAQKVTVEHPTEYYKWKSWRNSSFFSKRQIFKAKQERNRNCALAPLPPDTDRIISKSLQIQNSLQYTKILVLV